MTMNDIRWRCEVCGNLRPDDKISVHTVDVSEKWGLPVRCAQRNVNYCNDRQSCIDGAPAKVDESPTHPDKLVHPKVREKWDSQMDALVEEDRNRG